MPITDSNVSLTQTPPLANIFQPSLASILNFQYMYSSHEAEYGSHVKWRRLVDQTLVAIYKNTNRPYH